MSVGVKNISFLALRLFLACNFWWVIMTIANINIRLFISAMLIYFTRFIRGLLFAYLAEKCIQVARIYSRYSLLLIQALRAVRGE
jgi:hypothetical protein